MNTGGPAFPGTLLDWMAGQALAGLIDFYAHHGCVTVGDIAKDTYDYAAAMLAEKARREATGKQDLQVQDHSGEANKMVWKQSPNMSSAVVCETHFSKTNADDENVEAYGGYLVAESVPLEAMDLIIRAPKLVAQNRELTERIKRLEEASDTLIDAIKSVQCWSETHVGDCIEQLQLVRAALKETKP